VLTSLSNTNADGLKSAVAHILIVDDRVDDLRAITDLLQSPGCNIVTATSGAEGLKHLLRTEFAVILLDMKMPEMNGLEFAALVRGRKRSCQTPIIFLTAAGDDSATIYRAYSLGAVDYLTKPPDESALRAKVAVFVDLYRKEQLIKRQAEMLVQARVAEEKLLSEKRYRSLVEMVPSCVVQMDRRGNIRYANRAFLTQSGMSRDDAALERSSSQVLRQLIHSTDEARFAKDWEGWLSECVAFRAELRLRMRNGDYHWHLCEFVPECNDDGEVQGWLAFFTDCEELKQAIGARDEFLALASHELRNPLMPMLNSIYILKSADRNSERASRAITVIERQIGHLTRLVDDLLDVTRVARGKLHLQRQPADLVELARKTAEDHEACFSGEGIEFHTSLPDEPVWVDVDHTRMAQVISNLLGNAQKFTPRGGRVELSVTSAAGLATVRVQDNGTGISDDVLGSLFEPFMQGQRAAQSGGGLGLGLALVKGLVELHGGNVSVSSDGPGSGSTFTMSLPLHSVSVHSQRDAPELRGPSDDTGNGRKCRVLLVDDNPDARSSLRDVLELMGHHVDVSCDGYEGISVAETVHPDIVLCDIGLPGMDGYEVARRLKGAVPNAILVAMTGFASPSDRERALQAGFVKHLVKPPSLQEVEQLLAQL
jgi:PAS domain S-box-containing protein